MLRLSINAVSNLSGGGVTTLVGLLDGWRKIDAALEVTVYASQPRVMDAVRQAAPESRIVPFGVGLPLFQRLLLQHRRLGPDIAAGGCDVLLSTNMLVERCVQPQIGYHQSLLLFDDPSLLHSARHGAKRVLQVYGARRALRRATRNVFISNYVREQAERFVPSSRSRNAVVPNGLPEEVIAGAARPSTWNGDAHLLAVTSDDPHKDNPTFVRALAELVDADAATPWTMSVASNGTLQREKALAAELGVAQRITWAGFVDSDALDALYRRSLCLIHPAPREGFGLAPLEAMARRCAVVAAGSAAVPDIVGKAGLLVERGDAPAFAGAVRRLLDKPALRDELIEEGVRRVAGFSWVDSARRFYEVIRSLAPVGQER